jgi:hypothetical protein
MKPSHSFYDQPSSTYENPNLPSVHKKITSYGNFASRGSQPQNPGMAANFTLSSSTSQPTKRKLPFGF